MYMYVCVCVCVCVCVHKVEKLLSRGPSVWPKDSKGPLPLFANKELLECSHAHSVHIVPSCFPTLLCRQS